MLVVRQHGFDFKTPFSKEVGRLVVQKGPDSVVKVIIEKSCDGIIDGTGFEIWD